MDCILTFDVGTTAVKTCLFDRRFALLASASQEYDLLTPAAGIAELDPQTYWEAMKQGVRRAMEASQVRAVDVRAIVNTTQGETLIPVDAHGVPLSNAIVWLDARAGREADVLAGLIGKDSLYRHTGMPEAGAASPLAKVLWLKNREPGMFRRTCKILLLEDFLIHRMTGRFVSEQSLMTSTGYFDINSLGYWDVALKALDVSPELFPEILPCGQIVGRLTPKAAGELGLGEDTVVVTGAMDQSAAAIGAGSTGPGIVTETTGTALVMAAATTAPRFDSPGRLPIYLHYRPGLFLYLPYCPTAGMALKWFKTEFCADLAAEVQAKGGSVYERLGVLAGTSSAGARGLVFLPHLAGVVSPEANEQARGVFFGIGLETTRADFVRAVLESVGFLLRENIEAIQQVGAEVREIRSLGGGSASRLWGAIKADICRRDVHVMEQKEATSLGAAVLGAVALGWSPSVEDAARSANRTVEVFHPGAADQGAYDQAYAIYRMVYQDLRDVFKKRWKGQE